MFNIGAPNIEIGRLGIVDVFPFCLLHEDASVNFWKVSFGHEVLDWKRDVEYMRKSTVTVVPCVGASQQLSIVPKTKYLSHCF
jgi:hypothetical protein